MRYVDDHAHDILDPEQHDAFAGSAERRRPGRGPVSTELLPLLRGDAMQDMEDEDVARSPPLVGIAFAVALSVPLWFVIGTVVWLAR